MKSKTLLMLVAVFLVLAGLAKCSGLRSRATKSEGGTKLVDFDINTVEKFTLASGTQSVVVARSGGKWTVISLGGYPADFDVVADNLRQLSQMKGDVIRGGENQLDEFGLAPTNEDYLAVTLAGPGGKEMGKVELGSPHLGGVGGYPDGQYVRDQRGAVLLVNEYLGGFPRRPEDWVKKDLLNVARSEISYIMVGNEEGNPYGLMSAADGAWTLSDLSDNETMNPEAAANVAGALSSLDLLSVSDPANAPEVSGSAFVAKTTNGVVYNVITGDRVAEGRIATVDISYEGSDSNEIARIAAEQDRISKWVYVLPESSAQNLTLPREQLVTVKSNAEQTTSPTIPSPVSPTPAN